VWSSSLSRAWDVDGRVPLGEVAAVELAELKRRPSMVAPTVSGQKTGERERSGWSERKQRRLNYVAAGRGPWSQQHYGREVLFGVGGSYGGEDCWEDTKD
jgi:hypothetical protein